MAEVTPTDAGSPQAPTAADTAAAEFDAIAAQVVMMLGQQSMRWMQESLSEAQQD